MVVLRLGRRLLSDGGGGSQAGSHRITCRQVTTAVAYGMLCHMGKTRKYTAFLPEELVADAQALTGAGVTETLKLGLEELRQKQAFKLLEELRGKVKFDLSLKELREGD